MPTISRFYGIVIRMFYDDHFPAHFHAVYNEYELVVGVSPLQVLAGRSPNRVRSLVLEWAGAHLEELTENWNRCRAGQQPRRIEPLE